MENRYGHPELFQPRESQKTSFPTLRKKNVMSLLKFRVQVFSLAFIINPIAFRELYMTGKKTDRIDAKRLADRLMYHIEMNDTDDWFPEVYVPDEGALEIRRLVTTYELLVKKGTQLKNQLKAIGICQYSLCQFLRGIALK